MLRSLLALGAILLAGCGSSNSEQAVTDPAQLHVVPPVDLRKHDVPLRDVVFDTFDGRFIRLSESREHQRRALMDRIRPIYQPRFGDPQELPWLTDDELVLGYLADGNAYAFPLAVLNFRELVNDELGDEPVLVSYCPLCGSAIVYSRKLDGKTLLFGNTSALYQSDLVMFDHQTGSYWFQVGGDAIVGGLTGERLRPLPSSTASWGEWRRLHPDTRVLVGDGAERFDAGYAGDPFAGYAERLDAGDFPFPVSRKRLDRRLRASEVVLTVEANGSAKAYAPRLIGDAAVNDEVGGEPVVVLSRSTGFSTAFAARAGGRRLTFSLRRGELVDRETGSRWDGAGRAVAGALRGAQLEPLPTRRAYWFAVSLAQPGLPVVTRP